jgi:hypothetical protein
MENKRQENFFFFCGRREWTSVKQTDSREFKFQNVLTLPLIATGDNHSVIYKVVRANEGTLGLSASLAACTVTSLKPVPAVCGHALLVPSVIHVFSHW